MVDNASLTAMFIVINTTSLVITMGTAKQMTRYGFTRSQIFHKAWSLWRASRKAVQGLKNDPRMRRLSGESEMQPDTFSQCLEEAWDWARTIHADRQWIQRISIPANETERIEGQIISLNMKSRWTGRDMAHTSELSAQLARTRMAA